MIYHIYWGTAGSAGLYLDEIYQTLAQNGYRQKAFVSYYYPFDYGEKVFFKRTEIEHTRYKGAVRKLLMGFELVVAFSKVFISSIKDKPKVINYSYVSVGSSIICFFLRLIKKFNRSKLVITCHDVVPNVHNEKRFKEEMKIKTKIYDLADYYLVHNPSSVDDLKRLFGIDKEKTVSHLFPIMDLSKIDNDVNPKENKYDFLFIGHMRKEKGVDILIDTWLEFHKKNEQAKLCLAGNPAYYKDYIDSKKEQCKESNIDLKLGFVKDDEYIRLVKESKCVVFPYTSGTNSGVISTVLSLGCDVIASNVSMFANNPLIDRDCLFEAGNKDALLAKLNAYYNGKLVCNSKERLRQYRMDYDKQVVDVYSKLIDNK
jgi:glycosyltransferase involved in cell wall biosynthesis